MGVSGGKSGLLPPLTPSLPEQRQKKPTKTKGLNKIQSHSIIWKCPSSNPKSLVITRARKISNWMKKKKILDVNSKIKGTLELSHNDFKETMLKSLQWAVTNMLGTSEKIEKSSAKK